MCGIGSTVCAFKFLTSFAAARGARVKKLRHLGGRTQPQILDDPTLRLSGPKNEVDPKNCRYTQRNDSRKL